MDANILDGLRTMLEGIKKEDAMKKILVVEDNEAAYPAIKEAFSGFGTVEIVADLSGFYKAVIVGKPNLVVTDMFFPYKTGSGKRELGLELGKEIEKAISRSEERSGGPNGNTRNAREGLAEWMGSQDEADQPLGLEVVTICEGRDIPVVVASNLNHHASKFEGVVRLLGERRYSFYEAKGKKEIIFEGSERSEEIADKGSLHFWENLVKWLKSRQ